MADQVKYAYLYDKQNRTESFGQIIQAHNYGKIKNDVERAARQVLPKRVEEYLILEVTKQAPFGTFLSDILSSEFEGVISHTRERIERLEQLEREKEFEQELYAKQTQQSEQMQHREQIRKLEETIREEEKPNDGELEYFFRNDIGPLTDWWKDMLWKDIQKDVKGLYMTRRYIEMCIEHPQLYSFGNFQRLLCSVCEHPWHLQPLGFFAPANAATSEQYFFCDRILDPASYCIEFSKGDMNSHLEYALLKWNDEIYLTGATVDVFNVSNITDVVLSSLFYLLQEQTAIKKCANCGKFFVPLARADAIYCDRPAPQDTARTCKAYGSKVLWYTNVVSDDVAKLARNIYCAKQMLVKRNPDKPEYAEMFEYFKAEKKVWEQQIKAGTKTREEFAEWLRTVKLCKTLGELEQS